MDFWVLASWLGDSRPIVKYFLQETIKEHMELRDKYTNINTNINNNY